MTDPATCPHDTTQPVDIRSHETGGTLTVARICVACLIQLPTAWGCDQCEWTQVRRVCDPAPTLILAAPCQEHA